MVEPPAQVRARLRQRLTSSVAVAGPVAFTRHRGLALGPVPGPGSNGRRQPRLRRLRRLRGGCCNGAGSPVDPRDSIPGGRRPSPCPVRSPRPPSFPLQSCPGPSPRATRSRPPFQHPRRSTTGEHQPGLRSRLQLLKRPPPLAPRQSRAPPPRAFRVTRDRTGAWRPRGSFCKRAGPRWFAGTAKAPSPPSRNTPCGSLKGSSPKREKPLEFKYLWRRIAILRPAALWGPSAGHIQTVSSAPHSRKQSWARFNDGFRSSTQSTQ